MYGYKFLYVESLDGHTIPGTSKNAVCNLALVKLEIPDDTEVVYPINKEYYLNRDVAVSFWDLVQKEILFSSDYVKSKKCRCSKAKIVEVIKYFSGEHYPSNYLCDVLYNMTCNLQPSDLIFKSMWNPDFIYKFNEYIKPDKLDGDICLECSNGIHFCRTIEDAIDYIEISGYIIMDKEETK